MDPSGESALMRVSRRSFVFSSVVTPLLVNAVGACSNEREDPPPVEIPQVKRQVHVALPATRTWSTEQQAKLVLRVGTKDYALKSHTDDTLGAMLTGTGELLGTERQPTHYVDAAEFSAEGVQLYSAGVEALEGSLSPMLFGVHVPAAQREHLDGLEGTLGSTGREWLGDDNPVVDPNGFLSPDSQSNASWLLFTQLGIMTPEPQFAELILSMMYGLSEFGDLVAELQNLDEFSYDDAVVGKTPWMTQRYIFDAQGQKIQRTNLATLEPLTRTVKDAAGRSKEEPVYHTEFVVADRVKRAKALATRALERAINNEPRLRGLGRMRPPVVAESTRQVGLPDADALVSELLGSGSAASESARDVAPQISLPDNRSRKSLRQLTVAYGGREHGRDELKIEALVSGALSSLFSYEQFNAKDQTTDQGILAYVPGVYFPGPRLSAFEEKREAELTLGNDVARVHFYGHQLRLAGRSDSDRDHPTYYYITYLLSLVLEISIPTVLAVLGAYHGFTAVNAQSLAKESLELLREFLPELASLIISAFVQIARGGSVSASLAEILLAAILKLATQRLKVVLIKVFAKLFKFSATAAAQAVFAATAPVVGQILAGIAVVQGIAQLVAIGAAAASGENGTVKWVLRRTYPVRVTIEPNRPTIATFPERVTEVRITYATPENSSKAIETRHKLATSTTLQSLSTYAFDPVRVTYDAKVECTVELFNGPDLVGKGLAKLSQNAPMPDNTTPNSVTAKIDLVAARLDDKTRLRESRRFGMLASGRAWSDPGADAPGYRPPLWRGDARVAPSNVAVDQSNSLIGYGFSTDFLAPVPGFFGQGHLVGRTPPVFPAPAAFNSFPGALDAGGHVLLRRYGYAPSDTGPRSLGGYVIRIIRRPDPSSGGTIDRYVAVRFEDAAGMTRIIPTDEEAKANPNLRLGFVGTSILCAKLHPTNAALLALTADAVGPLFESFCTIDSPQPQYHWSREEGKVLGTFDNAVSLVGVRNKDLCLVLEQGARRIQAVTTAGAVASDPDFFGGRSQFALQTSAERTYLDIEVDGNNNIWVLSSLGDATSIIEVFAGNSRAGQGPIAEFREVNARWVALDDGSTVYTVANGANKGVGTYPEPTLSVWVPQNG
jgi:hypothetical protein